MKRKAAGTRKNSVSEEEGEGGEEENQEVEGQNAKATNKFLKSPHKQEQHKRTFSQSANSTPLSVASSLTSFDANSNNSPSRGPPWTAEEDEKLRQAVKQFKGKHWKFVAQKLGTRTRAQCAHRWQKVLNPSLKKGSWTFEEDEMLEVAVKTSEPGRWAQVAEKVPGRNGKQCRERWYNHLAPDVNKAAWTLEEDEKIETAYNELGPRWADIARKLPGRSENAIKNRWHARLCPEIKWKRENGGSLSAASSPFPSSIVLPPISSTSSHLGQSSLPSSPFSFSAISTPPSKHKIASSSSLSAVVATNATSFSPGGMMSFSTQPLRHYYRDSPISLPPSPQVVVKKSRTSSTDSESMTAAIALKSLATS